MRNVTPIDRRQFIKQFAGGVTAAFATFLILPSSLTYQRIWKFALSRPQAAPSCVSASAFADFLLHQTPEYDRLILQDIKPGCSIIGMVPTGRWEAFLPTKGSLIQRPKTGDLFLGNRSYGN